MCAPLRYCKGCCKKFICNWARIYDPLSQSFSILDDGMGGVDSKQKTKFLFRYHVVFNGPPLPPVTIQGRTKFEVPIRMRLGRSTAHLASPFVWIFKFSTTLYCNGTSPAFASDCVYFSSVWVGYYAWWHIGAFTTDNRLNGVIVNASDLLIRRSSYDGRSGMSPVTEVLRIN